MHVAHAKNAKLQPEQRDIFTGDVSTAMLAGEDAGERLRLNLVRFSAGTQTIRIVTPSSRDCSSLRARASSRRKSTNMSSKRGTQSSSSPGRSTGTELPTPLRWPTCLSASRAAPRCSSPSTRSRPPASRFVFVMLSPRSMTKMRATNREQSSFLRLTTAPSPRAGRGVAPPHRNRLQSPGRQSSRQQSGGEPGRPLLADRPVCLRAPA